MEGEVALHVSRSPAVENEKVERPNQVDQGPPLRVGVGGGWKVKGRAFRGQASDACFGALEEGSFGAPLAQLPVRAFIEMARTGVKVPGE